MSDIVDGTVSSSPFVLSLAPEVKQSTQLANAPVLLMVGSILVGSPVCI